MGRANGRTITTTTTTTTTTTGYRYIHVASSTALVFFLGNTPGIIYIYIYIYHITVKVDPPQGRITARSQHDTMTHSHSTINLPKVARPTAVVAKRLLRETELLVV